MKYLTVVHNVDNLSKIDLELLVKANTVRYTAWGHIPHELEKIDTSYKSKYEDLKYEIKNMLKNAQSLYDDMKRNGLDIGMIESEGYLRAVITMANTIDYIEESYDLDDSV